MNAGSSGHLAAMPVDQKTASDILPGAAPRGQLPRRCLAPLFEHAGSGPPSEPQGAHLSINGRSIVDEAPPIHLANRELDSSRVRYPVRGSGRPCAGVDPLGRYDLSARRSGAPSLGQQKIAHDLLRYPPPSDNYLDPLAPSDLLGFVASGCVDPVGPTTPGYCGPVVCALVPVFGTAALPVAGVPVC